MNKLRIKVFNKRALRMSLLGIVARAQQLGSAKVLAHSHKYSIQVV